VTKNKSLVDLLQKLLALDVEKRPDSLDTVLKSAYFTDLISNEEYTKGMSKLF